ncbi:MULTISPECIES: 1-acyl-sn-glycerol-3-phosphate acyltransferase [unclassified Rhizobacter]|uniref:lysophospholipid acyltransferase family protein n=1 Tax=unclassified Rhizobacter TaxID=2640088 RepID=UPI0006F8A788|nr:MULTISPECIES: lysophospholipid acyltransferase family protein [unclassified Rhizobacter]KQU67177.1 acyl-phosphate glycerol 3-phosphate acyltransferase [Rhizobacter sp. Root29]KQV98112.1 acyl-phosphate glycerol 3-phosphate acyltransferase [Rhizobacter sp. Root1238]KRB02010.1 acyl-phosphate glycerol 3-phosphate acyltransferase [Rhizobacter sp. Root16D2]
MSKFIAALRSLLFVLWMAATVIPWAVFSLIASIFMRGTPLFWFTTFWLRIAITGCRFICGVRYQVQGMENLPDGPAILCPKHQSTWETFAFPTLMPRPLCYVFKRELLYIPFFGWAMARLDMVHIDRSKRTEAWSRVAEQGQRFMSQGNWVIMFPEGTRIARGQQGTYKTGATRLAVATGASVVPIAVNSARCWPRKSFLIRPGLVTVSIGKPIAPAGRQADELMREVETWIEAEMRRIDPEAYSTQ